MSKKLINLGNENAGNGDPLRIAFSKINDNFSELYTLIGGGNGVDLTELAQDYGAAMFIGSQHTGITFAYDDVLNKITASVAPISWVDDARLTNKPTKLSQFINDGDGSVDVNNNSTSQFALLSDVQTAIDSQVVNNFNRLQILDDSQVFLNDSNILIADNSVDTLSFRAGAGVTMIPNKELDSVTFAVVPEYIQDRAVELLTTGTHSGITATYVDEANKLNLTVVIDGGNANSTY